MKAAIVVYPGSNCDRDLARAFAAAGAEVSMVWHKEPDLPAGTDVVGLPGGFSFGDYLRCGAIAARSPVTAAVMRHARRGGHVLGVCNGFQILLEAGLLPGALMRNAQIKYICRDVALEVTGAQSAFTAQYRAGATITVPIAHHDGSFFADQAIRERLEGEGLVAFRYVEPVNGSLGRIAGILSDNRRVLGMMPHPERAADPALGGVDGQPLFAGLVEHAAAAGALA